MWVPGIDFEPTIYPWTWPIINLGCTDEFACNYDTSATNDDGSCEYPTEYYDCDGNCLNDLDLDGICNELDNCPEDYNPNQEDFNVDNEGDACDGISVADYKYSKNLIKIVDVFGREVNKTRKKNTLIYIYDDGSIEKTIVFY